MIAASKGFFKITGEKFFPEMIMFRLARSVSAPAMTMVLEPLLPLSLSLLSS